MTEVADVATIWEWLAPALEEFKTGYLQAPTAPWEERWEELLGRLGVGDASEHPVTDALFRLLDELSDDDRERILEGDQLEAVALGVVKQLVEAGNAAYADPEPATSGGSDEGYDEAAWYAFIAECLPSWDGTSEAWGTFKEWFIYYAEQRELAQPAHDLLGYLESLDLDGRVSAFADYGVALAPQRTLSAEPTAESLSTSAEVAVPEPAASGGSGDGYDEAAWYALTAECLPSWDGTSEAWGTFKEWFIYYAEQRELAQPAHDLLGYLESLDLDGRVSAFAEYGVAIAPQATAPSDQPTAERLSTHAEPAVLDENDDALLANIVAEDPEAFENIDKETLRQLMAEVLAEETATPETERSE